MTQTSTTQTEQTETAPGAPTAAIDVQVSRDTLDASYANRGAFWKALESLGARESDVFRVVFENGESYMATDLKFLHDEHLGARDLADDAFMMAAMDDLVHIAWYAPEADGGR